MQKKRIEPLIVPFQKCIELHWGYEIILKDRLFE